jgi:hypothetical protein
MDRSRQIQRLEQAERHLLHGEQNVSDQEQRIEDLEHHGHDASLGARYWKHSSARKRSSSLTAIKSLENSTTLECGSTTPHTTALRGN